MIKTKKDLKDYLEYEKNIYLKQNKFGLYLTNNYRYKIYNYLVLLRKEEYYLNNNSKLFYLYRRKKRKLGLKLGIDIGPNCAEKGLNIIHPFSIIINGDSKIGKNCTIHGNVCIGNKGTSFKSLIIGDNVKIGIGSVIIGDITIGNNVIIGANSLVNKSFTDSCIVAGNPAKIIRKGD